jgi:pyruvate dehydrogenase E2 component (dihydrolipoamide acetyltransferase)
MPEITPDMTHGTVMSWTVAEGSLVSVGDTFCHIKVDNFTYDGKPGNMEVEAIETGYIARFLVQEGETVSKHEPIAIFSETPHNASEFAHLAPTQEEGRNTTFAWQAYTLPDK